jgi:NAD(P)-dependent dehydrogenase (short-subunit alcohol dehydrogenase family)
MWTKKDIPAQNGRTAIVTGSNAGVGFETALALYECGARVILACRNMKSAEEALAKMKEHKGAGSLEAAWLDLSSLQSVRQFSDKFAKENTRLDLLINNAGVMIPPASKTSEGFELQFGVNFLGHFALSSYMYPLLNVTTGSRVVTVSSLAYLRGAIDFDNLKSEKSYEPMREYAQSKLADLLFALEFERRIVAAHGQSISIAAQPGANNTELSRHMSRDAFAAAVERVGTLMEPWQGALPSLYAAVSRDAQGGKLYGPDQDGGYRGYPAEAVIAPHALDENLARRLWEFAQTVTGVQYAWNG